jgi:hypothetical protein
LKERSASLRLEVMGGQTSVMKEDEMNRYSEMAVE